MKDEKLLHLNYAIVVASLAHLRQHDKAGNPYILHPIAVMEIVRKQGYDSVHQIVAVLHDVVEDCKSVTLEDIKETFGSEVSVAIDALSRRESETYDAFISRVKLNEIARVIKLADLEHNTSPERVANLSVEMRDIVKRYEKAKAKLKA